MINPSKTLSHYTSDREHRIWTWVTNLSLVISCLASTAWALRLFRHDDLLSYTVITTIAPAVGWTVWLVLLVAAIHVRKRQLQRRAGER